MPITEELRPRAFAVAYRMLGSVSDAEDIVQEALLRLHNTLEQNERIESPCAYISTVVTRLCIDQLRAQRTCGPSNEDLHGNSSIVSVTYRDGIGGRPVTLLRAPSHSRRWMWSETHGADPAELARCRPAVREGGPCGRVGLGIPSPGVAA